MIFLSEEALSVSLVAVFMAGEMVEDFHQILTLAENGFTDQL